MRDHSKDPCWNPTLYDEKHAFVWKYGAALINLLSPKPGERILDLGCGTGHLTAKIASLRADVTGIDLDPGMISQARRNYPDLPFDVGDARHFHTDKPFDAVFSNAMLHWVTEPASAAACIGRALKPGGRFVAEFGGRGNVDKILTAIHAALDDFGFSRQETPDPWCFPSIEKYAFLLGEQGLKVISASLFDRPTPLEDGEKGLRHWMEGFAGRLLAAVPSENYENLLQRIEAHLRPISFREGGWVVDYKRIRVVAVKEEV